MKILIDAFSWIEYLEGGQKGIKVNEILNSNNEIFTLPITISEVVSKVKRKEKDSNLVYNLMIKSSKIVETTPEIAKEAGLIHAETRKNMPNFGIVDAILIATARATNSKVLTGDSHFKSFKEAIIL